MKEGIVHCYLGSISDLADNQSYIGINMRAFKVKNESDFDILPPVFDSLSLSREIVTKTDTQNFVFYLHDNLSGIDPKSLLAIFGSTYSPDEEIIAVFPERTGINTYSASIKGEKLRPGFYFLSGLVISDSANNQFQHDDDFGKGYGFEVADDHAPDTKAPELISYHIYPELVQPGDTVYIEVKTKDEGYGVMGVYAFLANPYGTDAAQFEWNDWTKATANDTFIFKTNYIVPQFAGNGTWVFYQTYVLDFAVNSRILENGSDYTNATFEVTGGQSLPNRPPRWILNDINLTVEAGSPFGYKIPDYLVADIDGDEISFSASMQNGSNVLPWIAFTAENLQVILNPESEHKGSYTVLVKATDTDGLHEELRVNILVEGPDGTNSHVSDNFSVYPNPATDILNFEGLSNIKLISFYSIHGELILTTSGSSGQVDVSDLERGVYIVRIESEKMTVIRKITLIHGF